MKKVEQNKERKKGKILAAAQQVFMSEGYVQASMDKVAAQAQVTKQTVYRYFPSKIDLFQATLTELGKSTENSFLAHLQNPDTREALFGFANDFIRFHVSDDHVATFRLLVTESVKAPEITRSFMEVGPDYTSEALGAFFTERLKIEKSEPLARLWAGMLLEPRSGVLVGMKKPTKNQIKSHANAATNFLLASIS